MAVSKDLCSHEPLCITPQAEQKASCHRQLTHLKDELFFPSKLRSQHCLWHIVLVFCASVSICEVRVEVLFVVVDTVLRWFKPSALCPQPGIQLSTRKASKGFWKML